MAFPFTPCTSIALATIIILELATTIFPIPASILLLLLDIAPTISMGFNTPTAASTMLPIGVLAYQLPRFPALSVTAVELAASTGIAYWFWPAEKFTWPNVMPSLLLTSGSALFGRYLRQRGQHFQERLEAERIRYQNAMFLRNAQIADDIHDAVSGELSLIARTAQRQTTLDPEHAAVWNQINESALQALHDVHRVIDTLDGTESGPNELAESSFGHALRQCLDTADDRLHAAGFHGSSLLHIDGDAKDLPDERSHELIMKLLHEITANIIAHADASDEYNISVLWEATGLSITQTNATNDTIIQERRGHGMAFYRKAISRRGGHLDTEITSDGLWVLHTQIPFDIQ